MFDGSDEASCHCHAEQSLSGLKHQRSVKTLNMLPSPVEQNQTKIHKIYLTRFAM